MTETDSTVTEPTGDDGFQTGRVATIAGAHAVNDTFTAFLPPLLPRFVEAFSLSNMAAGSLSAFLQIPSLLQPVIGHLADKTTLKWIVILGPGVTATIISFLGWAPGYFAMALMLLTAGLSVAAFHATAPVAAGYLSGKRLGRGMGFWMVGGELGRTIGPLVVVSTLALVSFRSLAFLSLAGVATSAILYFRLRDVPLRSRAEGDQVDWRPAVRAMGGFMTVLAGLVALRSLMVMATTIFLPLFLVESGTGGWLAGAALSIIEAAGIAGAFGGGGSQTTFGPRGTATILSKITTISAVLSMITSMGLWILSAKGDKSVVRGAEAPAKTAAAETAKKENRAQIPAEKKKSEEKTQQAQEKKPPEKK